MGYAYSGTCFGDTAAALAAFRSDFPYATNNLLVNLNSATISGTGLISYVATTQTITSATKTTGATVTIGGGGTTTPPTPTATINCTLTPTDPACASAGVDSTTTNALLGDIRKLLNGDGFISNGNVDPSVNLANVDYVQHLATSAQSALVSQDADESSLLGWFALDLPAASCTAWTGNLHGVNFSFDWCPYAEFLRSLLSWLMALFGALTIYRVIFQPNSA